MAGLISVVRFSKILNKNLTLNFKNKMKQDHFVQQKLAMMQGNIFQFLLLEEGKRVSSFHIE